jgi:membrane protease YdiL (CAAX protease family)
MDALLGDRLKLDWKVGTVTVVSTLLLILDRYHLFTRDKYWDRVILYLVVPLVIVAVVFRESPVLYGFTAGDWKAGMAWTCIGIGFMTPILYLLGSGNDSMRDYYIRFANGLPWTTFLDLIGWEFLFRGWILFTYRRKFGPEAVWLQAVPFAIAHIGKPELETLSTIFGGFAFGFIALRTGSFLWPFLIHWFIATFIILVAAGSHG